MLLRWHKHKTQTKTKNHFQRFIGETKTNNKETLIVRSSLIARFIWKLKFILISDEVVNHRIPSNWLTSKELKERKSFDETFSNRIDQVLEFLLRTVSKFILYSCTEV